MSNRIIAIGVAISTLMLTILVARPSLSIETSFVKCSTGIGSMRSLPGGDYSRVELSVFDTILDAEIMPPSCPSPYEMCLLVELPEAADIPTVWDMEIQPYLGGTTFTLPGMTEERYVEYVHEYCRSPLEAYDKVFGDWGLDDWEEVAR